MATKSYETYCDDLLAKYSTCYGCETKDRERQDCSEYLQEVIEQIYGKIPLDKGNLEHALDQLCAYLGVKPVFNAYGPMIERSNNGLCEMVRTTVKSN